MDFLNTARRGYEPCPHRVAPAGVLGLGPSPARREREITVRIDAIGEGVTLAYIVSGSGLPLVSGRNGAAMTPRMKNSPTIVAAGP